MKELKPRIHDDSNGLDYILVAVMPAFGSILTAVMITVSSIHEEMPEEYVSFLIRCREIVRRGELRKKKGKDKYRQYVWQTPSVMPEWR